MILNLVTVLAAVGAQQAIHDTVFVEGAGARLFVELRGPEQKAPILLYLHGGPGNALGLIAFRASVGPALESHALVAYLHQRSVLRSTPVADTAQTIANHVTDVRRVIEYLTQRFPERPLFLLGHSWGGFLAIKVVERDSSGIAGIVSVSATFDPTATARASYEHTLAWAKRAGRDSIVEALNALGPPPFTRLEQQATLSQWASLGNGGIGQHLDIKVVFGRAPFQQPQSQWVATQLAIAGAMLPELNRTTAMGLLATIRLPLLLLVGERDLITPPESLREPYARWGGPKSFVVMSRSHHLPFVDEPARFSELVTDFLRRWAGRPAPTSASRRPGAA